MSILWNRKKQDHKRKLLELLESCTQFDCAVAFAKESGFSLIKQTLVERLDEGARVRFAVGLDFYLSEPSVLRELLNLDKKYPNMTAFISKSDGHSFHPKFYSFHIAKKNSILIGSANLTRGGLQDNHEISIHLESEVHSELTSYMDVLIDSKVVKRLKEDDLLDYSEKYNYNRVVVSIARKKVARMESNGKLEYGSLEEIYKEMIADRSDSGFAFQARRRKSNRLKARRILRKIAASRQLKAANFLRLYNQLAGELWHSGGLRRSNSRIAKHPERFRDIVKYASENYKKDISSVFQGLLLRAKQLKGVGPNIISEILGTFDEKRYAVMNQNSVAGMELAGFDDFPKKPNKAMVSGESYLRFCSHAASIRNHLKLRDLGELDALFNYSYWKQK